MENKAYVSESRGRDKYGRSVLTVSIYHPDYKGVHVTGVVVTMPKYYREEYPRDAYLVNNWQKRGKDGVTYHAKRAAAIAFLKAELFAELAKVTAPDLEREKLLDLGEVLNRARAMANECRATESQQGVYGEVSGALFEVAKLLTGDHGRGEAVYQSVLDGNGFKTAVRLEQKQHEEMEAHHAGHEG